MEFYSSILIILPALYEQLPILTDNYQPWVVDIFAFIAGHHKTEFF